MQGESRYFLRNREIQSRNAVPSFRVQRNFSSRVKPVPKSSRVSVPATVSQLTGNTQQFDELLSPALSDKETLRLQLLSKKEDAYKSQGYMVAGVDEAGRGPLAGPVVAAACILPSNYLLSGINDSKKLSAKRRAQIYELLRADGRVQIGVAVVSPRVIDEINILQASLLAMRQAVEGLGCVPHVVLVDGQYPIRPPLSPDWADVRVEPVVRGDSQCLAIAAASIIAKHERDRMMVAYHGQYPEYNFAQHKGYPTKAHLAALARHGPCPIHRLTFAPLRPRTISPARQRRGSADSNSDLRQ
mmetsp:Transcript_25191/g.43493  ORF Transcript_25191/g.43493 Transcript_25191/m.43493 type:complete len:301 (+) Transcript_25191:169-1071(+)